MMAGDAVIVLYEDSLVPGGRPTAYGPHKLLEACVRDSGLLGFERRLDPRPMNGAAKALALVTPHLDLIAPSGQPVVLLLDGDKIRRALQLPPDAGDPQVIEEIQNRCAAAQRYRLNVVLLNQNLESVLEVLRGCDPAPSADYDMAIKDKKLNQRDIVFRRVATSTAKAIRDCLMDRLASWRTFAETVRQLLAPSAI